MQTMTIAKSKDWTFRTLAQAIREDAYRHMRRSARYASQNNFECADGSAAKSARKFRQAEDFETPPPSRAIQLLMMDIEIRMIMAGEILAD